jgi:hypothetical protein
VLRECEYKYRFLDELLFHIIRNKNRVGAVQSSYAVKTKLLSLTSNEAGRIGRSLAMMLMTNTNSRAAAEEYIFKYPALEELAAKFRWFKPMLGGIAEELMGNVLYVSVWGGGEASERARGRAGGGSAKKGRESSSEEECAAASARCAQRRSGCAAVLTPTILLRAGTAPRRGQLSEELCPRRTWSATA